MKRGDKGYWEWRKNTGKPKSIKSPELLWELACEYFEQLDENPIKKEELLKGGLFAGDVASVKLQRPYTWVGLEAYLYEKEVIAHLDAYRANDTGSYDAYQDVLRAIANIMRAQKFEGAAVGIFNAGIIQAELGMASKIEQSISIEQPLFPEVDNLD